MTRDDVLSQMTSNAGAPEPSASRESVVWLQERAVAAVRHWTARANEVPAEAGSAPMPVPAVRFDLRGRAAGVTVYKRKRTDVGVIRLNAELLVTNPDDMLNETVPHEVAHAAARWFHGTRIKPHGWEWRAIMHAFGKQPSTCHDLPTRPARRVTYYPYVCACPAPNYLSAIRHGRVQRGQQRYQCVRCGSRLRYEGGSPSHGHPDEAVGG